jgi:RsiW-degrading membrane proteinase PrsW (M82 family)
LLESKGFQTMTRNALYLVIGALVVVSAVLGYYFYQERQQASGIEITVGNSGISIEKK